MYKSACLTWRQGPWQQLHENWIASEVDFCPQHLPSASTGKVPEESDRDLRRGLRKCPELARSRRCSTRNHDPSGTLPGTGLLSAVTDEAVIDEAHGATTSTAKTASFRTKKLLASASGGRTYGRQDLYAAAVEAHAIARGPLTWQLYLLLGFFQFVISLQGNIFPFLKVELDIGYRTIGLHPTAYACGIIMVGCSVRGSSAVSVARGCSR